MRRRSAGHYCGPRHFHFRRIPLILFVLLGLLSLPVLAAPRTKNVIVVMTDGLRWQEVFQGADAALMNKENGAVSEPEALKKEFWRDPPTARREALMPFLWTTIAQQGQIYGNRTAGSEAWVT